MALVERMIARWGRVRPLAAVLGLLAAACGGPAPEPPAPPAAAPAAPAAEIPGLARVSPIPDGVPRLDYRLPDGALVTLVEIAAVPELAPPEPAFLLRIDADSQPLLAAVSWGGGPPPPALPDPPAIAPEDSAAAWSALARVPRGALAVLYLDGAISLGQAEPVLAVLVRRGVETVLWGFAGEAGAPENGPEAPAGGGSR